MKSPTMKDHSTFYKQVGEKIRSRRGKKLSQEALASAVGLTRTSISNIEKGRQRLLLHTLVDVADALQVEAASLLPDRPITQEPVGAETLAQLSVTERVFIESAIGFKQQKETHGHQEKEDSGVGPDASNGSEGHRGARPGLGDRPNKRGANRR
jgi:transcriptional regulator with XRE-family HTH domain